MKKRSSEKWSAFRLSVIGQLLHAPASHGDLAERLRELAAMTWTHPVSGMPTTFSIQTVERWFLAARRSANVFEALQRKIPSHAGTHPSVTPEVDKVLRSLRNENPMWTTQLLYDNMLTVLKGTNPPVESPSYATICRYARRHDLRRRRPPKRHEQRDGFIAREKRLFEATHVHAIWHGDFHKIARKVTNSRGEWQEVVLLAFLDDRSRLCCHAQWYPNFEDAQSFVHGLSQALQKRGLPRVLVTDNGAGMVAAETQEGLARLGIEHRPTLPRTPEQNGKQEVFWAQIDGRLMAMLDSVKPLTLEFLNRATQAWVEEEYQRRVHRETNQTPLDRSMAGPAVDRPSPSAESLRHCFKREVERQQRASDGTFTIDGVRFEVPNAFRTLRTLNIRYARWDLSTVDLVDATSGKLVTRLWPVDKEENADSKRRPLTTVASAGEAVTKPNEPAPLLRELLSRYASSGFPPAFIPLERTTPVVIDEGISR